MRVHYRTSLILRITTVLIKISTTWLEILWSRFIKGHLLWHFFIERKTRLFLDYWRFTSQVFTIKIAFAILSFRWLVHRDEFRSLLFSLGFSKSLLVSPANSLMFSQTFIDLLCVRFTLAKIRRTRYSSSRHYLYAHKKAPRCVGLFYGAEDETRVLLARV